MAWVLKIGRRVTYLVQKTVNGNVAYVKRRPAQVIGIASNGAPIIRLSGTSTVLGNASTGVARKTHTVGNAQVSRYVTW